MPGGARIGSGPTRPPRRSVKIARLLAFARLLYKLTVERTKGAPMSDLTERQAEILDLIRRRIVETGAPPTRLEIAAAFGFSSPNAAESHLKALARKGAILLDEGRARGIRLNKAALSALARNDDAGLPLVGRVAAGQPILAAENIEDHVAVDAALFVPRADYLLRVR